MISEREYRRIYRECYANKSFAPSATMVANREFENAMDAAFHRHSRNVSQHECRREIIKTKINGERVTVEWRR